MIVIRANGIESKVTYNSQIAPSELRKAIRYDVARAVENESIHNRIIIDDKVVFNQESQIKEVYNPMYKEVRKDLPYKEREARYATINAKIKKIKDAKIEELTDMIIKRITKASKPLAPPKKPVKASKPVKAASKKPVSTAKPSTLVAVVDGKFAPVNGFRYPKTEIKALVKSMDSVYARMYDGELDETQWVPIGDTMLKNNPRLVAAVVCERQDLLTSDREIAAFAYAVYHAKNRDRLMAMDRPAKARTPKTKRPTTAQMTFNPRTGKVGTTRRF